MGLTQGSTSRKFWIVDILIREARGIKGIYFSFFDFRFAHWNISIFDLFRISNLEFRVSVLNAHSLISRSQSGRLNPARGCALPGARKQKWAG